MEEAPWGTFQDELDWCIRQLETDLLRGDPSPVQVEDARHVLSVLQSQNAPVTRKRKVMHRAFGDYRHRMTAEHREQEAAGAAQQGAGAALRRQAGDGGSFTRTDNSFTFNFFPDGSAAGAREEAETPAAPMLTDTAAPGPSLLPGTGPGFAFDFRIPAEEQDAPRTLGDVQEGEDPKEGNSAAAQDTNPASEPPPSKSQKKKKKKKKAGDKIPAEGSESQAKQPAALQGPRPTPSGEPAAPSSDQQLARELDWCIEQLELGLHTQKSNPKQVEEATRALRTLRSSKAPLVKKRQVMRATLGDYRKKMEEEKAKQAKLLQAAVKSARVTAVSEPLKKPVFHRRAERRPQSGPLDRPDAPDPGVGGFVYTPAQDEFRFNFF
ncbi:UPF0488 protein C8orf33 homolog isoform X1 [Amia ocellicauda]|uniref:UPF0488 protein C8orf33 homolog isoform X1 n=1 Tax=Amia ocellicauda TaxID=2972642 RepID=UPI0034641FB6